MSGRLSTGSILFTILALLALPLLPGQAGVEAQNDTRFRVLIPNLQPEDDESSVNWGRRVGDRMREYIDQLNTHNVIPQDDVRDALDDFDLDEEDLDCITARQLASQIDAQLVMCGSYMDDGEFYHFEADFIAVESGDEMSVDRHQVVRERGDSDEAADYIFARFQEMAEAANYAAYCAQDFNSNNWDSALRTCNRAHELNPESTSVLFVRARTFMELDRHEDALDDFEAVLEEDPYHEAALENAGWVATQLERTEVALDFYERYLELNPENTNVRLRVAYDLAQGGGHEGALQLVEEGLEYDPDNVELWENIGAYAFRAAQNRRREIQAADGEEASLGSGVEEMYETAIEAYNRVLEERGEETDVGYLANTIRALLQLEETDRAIEQAERSIEARPDNAQLRALLAQALYDSGETEQAREAMLDVMELDDEYSNLYTRLGQWSLELGDNDEAIEYFNTAIEAGERTADQVARQIFGTAYNGYIQQDDYERGIALLEVAKEFDPSQEVRSELDFWHGFALFRRAERIQEPQTVESAEQALPLFQRARELFEAGAGYAEQMPQVNVEQFLDATDQYVEIQELIIRRG